MSDLISYDILRTWETRKPGGLSSFSEGLGQDKKVHVHCNVCNTGNVAGAEVVQCYSETLYASVVRPKKELIRFRRVFLEPGEKISLLTRKNSHIMAKTWKPSAAV